MAPSPYLNRDAPKRPKKKYRDKPDGAIAPAEHRAIIREQVRTGVLPYKQAEQEVRRRNTDKPQGKNPGRTTPREGGDTDAFRKFLKGAGFVNDFFNPLTPNNIRAAQQYKDAITSPLTSRREKVDAAFNTVVVGGGIGGGSGKPSPPEKPVLGPDKIREVLPEARRVRAEQETLRKAERRERVSAAKAAGEDAGGGEAGFRAARAEMRGEYARLPLDRLAKEYGTADSELRRSFQPQVDELLDSIEAHPSQAGLEFRIRNTQGALIKMLDGQAVTKSEIRALEGVFGEEATRHFKWRQLREKVNSALNLPRALQATGDISRMMRQDLIVLATRPGVWAKSEKAMIQAAKSPAKARLLMDELQARPNWDEYREVGLRMSDPKGSARLMEEDFLGADMAERIPVAGRLVAAASRAYNVGGSYSRANYYDLITSQKPNMTIQEKRELARFINAATGQGKLYPEQAEQAARFLTMGLFSPRFMASRVAFLNPQWYFSLKGPARVEAIRAFASTLAAGSAVLYLADKLPGVDVGKDSRSADFQKIKVGDTRIDIWGGFQQYVVAGARYVQKEKMNSSTGEVESVTREKIVGDFFKSKLAPLPGLGRDFHRGYTFDGGPVDKWTVANLFVPLNVQNTWGAKDDPALAAASFGLGGIGFGMQTYGPPKKKKTKSKAQKRTNRSVYVGGGGAGKSPYTRP